MNYSDQYKDYKWIKVKRYTMDENKSWEERYKELDEHHVKETTFLIDEVRKLAALLDVKQPTTLMGLGAIGSGWAPKPRKWRFMLEIKNGDNVVVPSCFIKQKGRPDHSGLSTLNHECETYWDLPMPRSQVTEEGIAALNGCTATIKLVDGCGAELEEWVIKDIKVFSVQSDYVDPGDDDLWVGLGIKYMIMNCEWKNLSKLWPGLDQPPVVC